MILKYNHKDNFKFSKSPRFSPIKVMNENITYDPILTHKRHSSIAIGAPDSGMGGFQSRFRYMPTKKKNGYTPSSFTYNTHSIASNRGVQCFRDHPR